MRSNRRPKGEENEEVKKRDGKVIKKKETTNRKNVVQEQHEKKKKHIRSEPCKIRMEEQQKIKGRESGEDWECGKRTRQTEE